MSQVPDAKGVRGGVDDRKVVRMTDVANIPLSKLDELAQFTKEVNHAQGTEENVIVCLTEGGYMNGRFYYSGSHLVVKHDGSSVRRLFV